jgi:YkoY family integral membrane protein
VPWNIHLADLATVGLLVVLESLLSADNALVMAVMVLGLPDRLHQRALNFGLIGAIVFRLGATTLAVFLIHAAWLKLLGGLYLVYLAGSHFVRTRRAPAAQPREAPTRSFWGTVVRVELVNLAFSVDSILVAVAMSQKFWVVLTGGILGVLAMRVVVSQLVAWIRRYPRLIDGAFVIVAWVGLKLLLDYAHQLAWIGWEIPQALSLMGIAIVLGVSYLVARGHPAPAAGSEGAT